MLHILLLPPHLQVAPAELGGFGARPSPAVITSLRHCLCRVALPLGAQAGPLCSASSLARSWIQDQLLPSCSLPRCPRLSVMAPLLMVFLVALMGLPVAQALECHVCAYNGDNCFKPMRCPDMATYCMTTRTYFTPYRMKVRKSCVPRCFETVYDGYSKHASATSCCQYYLCNGAGFATPVTLGLVPALLVTFRSLL